MVSSWAYMYRAHYKRLRTKTKKEEKEKKRVIQNKFSCNFLPALYNSSFIDFIFHIILSPCHSLQDRACGRGTDCILGWTFRNNPAKVRNRFRIVRRTSPINYYFNFVSLYIGL